MSEDHQLIESVETLLHKQITELEVVRMILQKFVVGMATSDPAMAEERLIGLKTSVVEAFERHPNPDERLQQMIKTSAEEFFDGPLRAISEARKRTGVGGSKH